MSSAGKSTFSIDLYAISVRFRQCLANFRTKDCAWRDEPFFIKRAQKSSLLKALGDIWPGLLKQVLYFDPRYNQ